MAKLYRSLSELRKRWPRRALARAFGEFGPRAAVGRRGRGRRTRAAANPTTANPSAAARPRNRRGMSHRARRRRWPPARAVGAAAKQGSRMNAPENVRREAEGAAGHSALGADGRRDGQINGAENITRTRPANRGDVIPRPEPAADRGRGQRAAFARTRRMRTSGRKKRFPCCAVRGWPLGALARAFGEFAPCADSGLRGADQADAGGGEPAPREPRVNRPSTGLIMFGGASPPVSLLRPACPLNLQNLGGLADAPRPASDIPPPDSGDCGGKCYNLHSAIISPAPPSPAAPDCGRAGRPVRQPDQADAGGGDPAPRELGAK